MTQDWAGAKVSGFNLLCSLWSLYHNYVHVGLSLTLSVAIARVMVRAMAMVRLDI